MSCSPTDPATPLSDRRPTRAALAAALVVASAFGVACGDGSDDPPADTRTIRVGSEVVAVDTLVKGFDALCDAGRSAAARDFARARIAFSDRGHTPLHTVARALEDVDRPAAARLLEAKQRVEADLDGSGTTTPGLAADLTALIAAARTGLDRLGIETQECP